MALTDDPTRPRDNAIDPTGLCVDPFDEHELAFWSSVWNVTAEEVRQAVRYVGTEADSVNRYLTLQRSQFAGLAH